MSFTTFTLLAVGLLVGSSMVLLLTSLRLRRLRTVPKPPQLAPETIQSFSAEARAGVKLQQACYNNDPRAASEALTKWAWASGEPAVANSLDQKMAALRNPEFRDAIKDLWSHLDAGNKKQWFGDLLWNAFLRSNPEFQELEFIG